MRNKIKHRQKVQDREIADTRGLDFNRSLTRIAESANDWNLTRGCRRFPCLALLLVLDSIYLHRPWVVYKRFSSQICWGGARWSYRKWRAGPDRKWPPVTCHVTPKWVGGCAHAQPEVGVLPPFFLVFWPEMTLPVVGFPRVRECATES